MPPTVRSPKRIFWVRIGSVCFRDVREEPRKSPPPQLYTSITLDPDSSHEKKEVRFKSASGGNEVALFQLDDRFRDKFYYILDDFQSLHKCNMRIAVYFKKLIGKSYIGSTAVPLNRVAVGPRHQELSLRDAQTGEETGRIEFNIEMTQVCFETMCNVPEVSIKGWDPSLVDGALYLLLQYYYAESRNGRHDTYKKLTPVNKVKKTPTFDGLNLVKFRGQYPNLMYAGLVMKLSFYNPHSKLVTDIGETKIPISKYYHSKETAVKFSELLEVPEDSPFKGLSLEGSIMFLYGPQLFQMAEGTNTDGRILNPKYPELPNFDFKQFKLARQPTMSSVLLPTAKEREVKHEEAEQEVKEGVFEEEEDFVKSEEEKRLENEYKSLLFDKTKSVELNQKNLVEFRDIFKKMLDEDEELQTQINDLKADYFSKLQELKLLEQKFIRPDGKLSLMEALCEIEENSELQDELQNELKNIEEGLSDDIETPLKPKEEQEEEEDTEDYDSGFVKISAADFETKGESKEPLREATPQAEKENLVFPAGGNAEGGGDFANEDIPPPPEMKRSATVGELIYEVPTDVVNELMQNFEDEQSVMKLLRDHGGDPDKVYEWLAFQLGIPPDLPPIAATVEIEEDYDLEERAVQYGQGESAAVGVAVVVQ